MSKKSVFIVDFKGKYQAADEMSTIHKNKLIIHLLHIKPAYVISTTYETKHSIFYLSSMIICIKKLSLYLFQLNNKNTRWSRSI